MTSQILACGHDFNNDTFKEYFKLHTLADGNIMNNTSSACTNGILSNGNSNNVRWEIGSLNQKKGTFSLLVRGGDGGIG